MAMRTSIKSTLITFSVGVAVLPVAIMALLISYMHFGIIKTADQQFEEVAISNTKRIAQDMIGMCSLIQKSRDDSLRRKRSKIYLFLEKYGMPSLNAETFEAETSNLLVAGAAALTKQRALAFGKTPLDGSEASAAFNAGLAELKKATRTEYAILSRMNEDGDMLFAASTLSDDAGKPFLHSYIPARHASGSDVEQIKDILQGKIYRGIFNAAGISMIVSIEPIFDAEQNVIGAIFLGVRQNVVNELCAYMEGVRIGENGAVWALETEDKDRSVFRVSKDGKRNGEVVQLDDNSNRRKNFQEIVDNSRRLADGEVGISIYEMRGPSDRNSQKRITCYAYFKPWNWVIGATSFTDDFARGSSIVKEQANSIFNNLAYGAAFVVLLTAFFVWYVASRIDSGFKSLKSIAESLTVGNIRAAKEKIRLHWKVGGKSPIKEMYEQFVLVTRMSENISSLIAQTQSGIDQLSATSAKISSSARDLDKFMSVQTRSVRDVGETTKIISNGAHKLNRQARTAADDVERTLRTATLTAGGLESLKLNSDELINSASEIASSLALINANAEKISTLVISISSLSEQTNLLSLNASVEAEKAGEVGLGFSVVAREVRKLADKTAAAASDVDRMVREMQSSVNSGVMEMDRFNVRMREGALSILGATGSLEKVVDEISELAPQFENLAKQIDNNAESAQLINLTMGEIGSSSLSTMERIAQFKRSTDSIALASSSLKDEISMFKGGEK